ncbi:hypothetical protein IWQ61_000186 [Dispira simplex]|nr:hypothetical protein IWQ61_000186 [Dispira simplex]
MHIRYSCLLLALLAAQDTVAHPRPAPNSQQWAQSVPAPQLVNTATGATPKAGFQSSGYINGGTGAPNAEVNQLGEICEEGEEVQPLAPPTVTAPLASEECDEPSTETAPPIETAPLASEDCEEQAGPPSDQYPVTPQPLDASLNTQSQPEQCIEPSPTGAPLSETGNVAPGGITNPEGPDASPLNGETNTPPGGSSGLPLDCDEEAIPSPEPIQGLTPDDCLDDNNLTPPAPGSQLPEPYPASPTTDTNQHQPLNGGASDLPPLPTVTETVTVVETVVLPPTNEAGLVPDKCIEVPSQSLDTPMETPASYPVQQTLVPPPEPKNFAVPSPEPLSGGTQGPITPEQCMELKASVQEPIFPENLANPPRFDPLSGKADPPPGDSQELTPGRDEVIPSPENTQGLAPVESCVDDTNQTSSAWNTQPQPTKCIESSPTGVPLSEMGNVAPADGTGSEEQPCEPNASPLNGETNTSPGNSQGLTPGRDEVIPSPEHTQGFASEEDCADNTNLMPSAPGSQLLEQYPASPTTDTNQYSPLNGGANPPPGNSQGLTPGCEEEVIPSPEPTGLVPEEGCLDSTNPTSTASNTQPQPTQCIEPSSAGTLLSGMDSVAPADGTGPPSPEGNSQLNPVPFPPGVGLPGATEPSPEEVASLAENSSPQDLAVTAPGKTPDPSALAPSDMKQDSRNLVDPNVPAVEPGNLQFDPNSAAANPTQPPNVATNYGASTATNGATQVFQRRSWSYRIPDNNYRKR